MTDEAVGPRSDSAEDRESGPPTAVRDPTGIRQRSRSLAASTRHRRDAAYEELQARRVRVPAVDLALRLYEKDSGIGGGMLAGAIAFRLFLWSLPAALLVVAVLGMESANGYGSPSESVRAIGITSIAAESVNKAAHEAQAARWEAAAVGGVFLYTTSVALLRGLTVVHAHIWHAAPPKLKSKPRAVAELLLLILAAGAGTSVAAVIRNRSPSFGLVAMLSVVFVYSSAWLLLSSRLPHGEAPIIHLIPGALLFGLGLQAMHLLLVYYLARRVTHASLWYGSLGVAATLLFGLYLGARLIVAASLLNATLWESRRAT